MADESSRFGCLAAAALPLVLGMGLGVAGFFFGDTIGYNDDTGQREPIGPTLYVLCAVFGSIGLAGAALALVPTKPRNGRGPRKQRGARPRG